MINPFRDYTDYSLFDYVQLIICFPIVIMRLIMITIITSLLCLSILIDSNKKYVETVTKLFSKALIFSCGFYNVKIRNKHIIHELINHNAILVYNHITILDSFFIFAFIKIVSPVVYYTFYDSLTFLMKYCDAISVNTDTPGIGNSVKILNHFKSNKTTISIAPEGGISNGKYMVQFKTGGFITNRPILPIILKFPNKLNVAWCNNTNIMFTVYTILSQLYNNAEIELLPLQWIMENEDIREFTDRVRKRMSESSGIPLIERDGYKNREIN